MPDVTISYDPNQTPQFTFNPSTVQMTGPGVVRLVRDANATWTFSDFQWCGTTQPPAGAFTETVNANNVILNDTFPNGASDNGEFSYQVAIKPTPTSEPVWSPDPEVDNDFPTVSYK